MVLSDVKNEDNLHFYNYTLIIEDETEREEARLFLISWVKFFMRYLPKEAIFIDSQLVERPKIDFEGVAHLKASSSIILCVEFDNSLHVHLQKGEMFIDRNGIEHG